MSLIDRLQTNAGRFWHGRAAWRVLETPAVVPADDGVLLFSMIGTSVVLPYLVAVKSLHRQLRRGRVVLLDDGSLTAADKAVLNAQLGRPEIIPIGSVKTGSCPTGGTWERLLTILDRRSDHYVIQIDSDTVTLGPVPQVEQAIAANRSFTLSGGRTEAPLGFLPVRNLSPASGRKAQRRRTSRRRSRAGSASCRSRGSGVTRVAARVLPALRAAARGARQRRHSRLRQSAWSGRVGRNGGPSRSRPIT